MYQNVVTAANARDLKAERTRQPEEIIEAEIEVSAFDAGPGLAGGHRYLNLETSTSLLVMNSSSAGVPRRVCSMPRLIAGMISSGSVTRSP